MLTVLDDMLWHQLPTTFDHVGPSDLRFFDRVWFAIYDPAGGRALQYTFAVYNNVNVIDGGMVFVDGDRQFNLRASRTLRPNFDLRCDPFQLEIVRALRQFRLIAVEGDHQLSADIQWTASSDPVEEAPHFHRKDGRIVENYVRFNQIGKADGTVRIGDQVIDITDWWACRDHSWGVRPNIAGIREPQSASGSVVNRGNFAFCFLFFSTNTVAGHLQMRLDDSAGNYFTAALIDRTSGKPIPTDRFTVRAELAPGSKRFATVQYTIDQEGKDPVVVTVRPISRGIVMPGLGYSGGWNDRRGLGAWRGAHTVESDIWDISDPERVENGTGKEWRPLHRIYPVRVDVSDGSSGTGSQTWLMTGEIPELTETGIAQ